MEYPDYAPTDRVKVAVNLEQLAKNLRLPDGAHVGEGMARFFLQHAGFDPADDGQWIGPRACLLRLNHSEVMRVESVAC
jgi:hypothetical protein